MKNLIHLALFLAVASAGVAQRTANNSTLESLVAAERAFAKTSEDKGTRPSFMEFIADDGILFRPNAVKGKQWMIEHPLPQSNSRDLLRWQPIFADVARAGDMGYTTGPWEYRNDIKDAKPVAFGNFTTVWKRQADGTWKFAIDLGISNPEPNAPPVPWTLPANYKQPSKGRVVNIESQRAALLTREREFSQVSAERGALKAFQSFAANDVRVFRNGKFPFVGSEMAQSAFSTTPNSWTWVPAFADVSSSGDLGYSYGTYQLKNSDSAQPSENGNYMRIWKKHGREWQVVLDVANPVPPPKQN